MTATSSRSEPPIASPNGPGPRILGIAGSVRTPSYTVTLTTAVTDALSARGAVIDRWDVAAHPLPVADPEYHRTPWDHPDPDVARLVGLADAADAIVLASPLYHNSFSGVLKNVLDQLSMAQFRFKPVGLLGHGRNRSTQAVDQLRTVVRGLRGVTTTTPLCTKEEDFTLDAAGVPRLKDPVIAERVDRFAEELLAFAAALRGLRVG